MATGGVAATRKPEPLDGHAKYQKVGHNDGCLGLQPPYFRPSPPNLLPHPLLQIKDLNSGTFGFVQLALDRTTGRNVAIKVGPCLVAVPPAGLRLPAASSGSAECGFKATRFCSC